MKRIDKLIIGELLGPWIFGVAIFTTLIMAGTYLFKITDYLVAGIPLGTIVWLTVLLLPGVVVKTFSMAVLLSTLLAFGRLSGDSEVVALRAAGASLGRIMIPVGIFGFIVAVVAFVINEGVVPPAAFKGTEIVSGIEKKLKGTSEPVFRAVYNPKSGKLMAMIMAKDFNLGERSLNEAWVVGYDEVGIPIGYLYAPGLIYRNENDWEVKRGARYVSFDLQTVVEVAGAYPRQIAQPPSIEDIAAARLKDLDSFSMNEMKKRIKIAEANPSFDKEQVRNLEYGYYNKIALPLATLIFGLLGAPLGIRNHRTGVAVGFSLSILIIFSYMMLTRIAAIWALGGAIHPAVASFAPIVIGLVGAVFLIWKKNN